PLVRSTCARLMVGRPSPQSPSISRLTSPPDRILSKCRRSRHQIPTPLATAPAELYTEDDFRQLVVAIDATPTSFGSLGELEDHGERGLVRDWGFRLSREKLYGGSLSSRLLKNPAA